MYLPVILLIVAVMVLAAVSFFAKTKRAQVLCILGYIASFAAALILFLSTVSRMDNDLLHLINQNMDKVMAAGLILIAISCISEIAVRKKRLDNEKKTAVRGLFLLGVLIFIGSNMVTIMTYVEITERDKPIVSVKENVEIYIGEEYEIGDIIKVENSHGEEFVKVVWAKGAYDDTSGIYVSEDEKTFTVSEGKGTLHIEILLHHAHYSDVEIVTVNVSVKEKQ